MKGVLLDMRGQAMVEYLLALTMFVVVMVFIGAWVRASQQSAQVGLHRQTFIRAPYTLYTSIGTSGQWVKDILFH